MLGSGKRGDAVEFGARLRRAREERGLSLREIAQTTKMPVSALERLERDDPSRLPGGIYIRSFVRAYAAAVGLDPARTLSDFFEKFPELAVPAVSHDTAASSSSHYGDETPRRAATLVMVVVVVGIAATLGWLAWRETQSAAGVEERVTTQAPAVSPAPPASGSRVGAAATPAPNPAVPARDPVAPTGKIDLTIHPTGSCWVEASVDGRIHVARLMSAGERVVVPMTGPIKLRIGDAGTFAFSINGTPARSLGVSGEVVRIEIRPDNLATFMIR